MSRDVTATLVDNHRRFLRFLETRVGSAAVAEDILQAAYVKSLERGDAIRDDESSIAWFYRLMRNALIDHYRRGGAERRATDRLGSLEDGVEPEPELKAVVCTCVDELIDTLSPDYAELLRLVDLQERSIADAAKRLDITPNNARVRLHRARKALGKQLAIACGTCAIHGCLDCTCSS